MEDKKLETKVTEPISTKLAKASITYMDYKSGNPWSPDEVDKMELSEDSYRKLLEACRFFYKHDALSSTVINKMVEIGITKLIFTQGSLTDNEFRIFTSIEEPLRTFAEDMSLEYLISGLVVPEYKVLPTTKEIVKELGIKKYPTLALPTDMYLRDPGTIIIHKSMSSSEPSYFVEVDEELVMFIRSGGYYPDGTKDLKTYEELLAKYPDFVNRIRKGERRFLLENKNIIRRKVRSDEPYPLPFLHAAIESLKHKRNLRRMDYSIAARVISAIQLVRLGSDEFPVTEDDSEMIDNIKNQMLWRGGSGKDVERIFQLFGPHTLDVSWVFPDVEALLNEGKYKDVNQDIIFALGFPKILITGETDKSNTSDAQYATMSPVKTMESMRSKVLKVIKAIVTDVSKANNLSSVPEVSFRPLQLSEFSTFVMALSKLYDTGNLSREDFADFFGYNFRDQLEKRKEEQKLLSASGVQEFAPVPHSNTPDSGGDTQKSQNKPANQDKKE